MNYAEIKYYDIANGLGVRTSLFVSGCTHRCKGCFNASAWDFAAGEPYTEETENMILESLKPGYIAGLSLLGGEPMEILNQRGLINLLRRVKRELPKKNIWCYTGYIYAADFQPEGRAYCEVTEEFLQLVDVLVDGEYVEDLRDISLHFRGSSNQRVIDLQKSRSLGGIIELDV